MEYGKFGTLEQLLVGYDNLEKQFTKKCQQLSELIKQNELKKAESGESYTESNKDCDKSSADTGITKLDENAIKCADENYENEKSSGQLPRAAENIDEGAKGAQNENTNCGSGTSEAAKIGNDCLASSPKGDLSRLDTDAKDAPYPDLLPTDERAIIDFIDKNKDFADKIFELWLIKNLPRTPKVIGGGGSLPSAPETKPKNIMEASKLSKHYFK